MRKVLILLFSLFAFYACDINSLKLMLINDTENTVYYQLFTDTVPSPNIHYRLLYPYETFKPAFYVGSPGTSWVNRINKYSIDSTLHIFIFQSDQITDEIIKNREYVRLSFKVKELDSLNWTVVYRGQNEIVEDED